MMPVLYGFSATKEIRMFELENNLRHIPVIAITASAMQNDIDHCLRNGVDCHFAKIF